MLKELFEWLKEQFTHIENVGGVMHSSRVLIPIVPPRIEPLVTQSVNAFVQYIAKDPDKILSNTETVIWIGQDMVTHGEEQSLRIVARVLSPIIFGQRSRDCYCMWIPGLEVTAEMQIEQANRLKRAVTELGYNVYGGFDD